jgi:hypothetical protein
VDVGANRLTAVVAGESLPDVGDEVTVHLPADRVHLFGVDGTSIA